MQKLRYIKSDAFTSGSSLGNPAACVFDDQRILTPAQMQQIATEHKGFVMETVFCSPSDYCDLRLTYYSSECEVDFCGHGTIATLYTVIRQSAHLARKQVLDVETNRKGSVKVYNNVSDEDAVYIEAPAPIHYPVSVYADEVEQILCLPAGAVDPDRAIRIIDAGLKTLIVPVRRFEDEIAVYPSETLLKQFCLQNDIDIILIFCAEVSDSRHFAHTRVFAPKFGYLEDPATGSGNSAFANYLLSEGLWDGSPISIEQGGNNRVFNVVKLKVMNQKVLFGGKATLKIEGSYYIK